MSKLIFECYELLTAVLEYHIVVTTCEKSTITMICDSLLDIYVRSSNYIAPIFEGWIGFIILRIAVSKLISERYKLETTLIEHHNRTGDTPKKPYSL